MKILLWIGAENKDEHKMINLLEKEPYAHPNLPYPIFVWILAYPSLFPATICNLT